LTYYSDDITGNITKRITKKAHTNDFNRGINEYPLDPQVISVCPIENEKKCNAYCSESLSLNSSLGLILRTSASKIIKGK
jgi:hypothetical protein